MFLTQLHPESKMMNNSLMIRKKLNFNKEFSNHVISFTLFDRLKPQALRFLVLFAMDSAQDCTFGGQMFKPHW